MVGSFRFTKVFINIVDIVYTYKKPKYPILNRDKHQSELIKLSCESARKVGYRPVLYTDDKTITSEVKFDEVNFISDDTKIWDSFKLYVLETREDKDYFISDYDIEYYIPLEFNDHCDIQFDCYEKNIGAWEKIYEPTLVQLIKLAELKNLKYFRLEKLHTINIGILKINNTKLRHRYIECWKELERITKNLNFNTFFLTPVISQYLLTLLVLDGKHSTQYNDRDDVTTPTKFYTHYNGGTKMKKIRVESLI